MIFTIWDSPETPVVTNDMLVYTWKGYAENGNTRSVFRYIENNDDRLRGKYLAWVHELGQYEVKGKKIADHFLFKDGFSYWWMTLFVEKSPWTQPSIIDAIRLFALDEIIRKENPGRVRLVSANRELHFVIKGLCEKLETPYEWQQVTATQIKKSRLENTYRRLPLFIQSFIALTRYFFDRWPLRNIGKLKWAGGQKAVFFCSYFFNLEAQQIAKGQFYSKQWAGLPAIAKKLELQQNWLQVYYAYEDVPNAKEAVAFAQAFNRAPEVNGFHAFVDSFLSLKTFLTVAGNYCKLLIRTKRLGNIEKAFTPAGTGFSLWPIMKKDWALTLTGPLAIHNLFYVTLFDKALSKIPKQKKGLFLFENLGWESAFIHAWRKSGHGVLVAVAHATVRYWDTRYFFDPRAILSKDTNKLPHADMVALNGKFAVDSLLRSGYPKERIIECEALRYLHFSNAQFKQKKIRQQGEPLRILILGDYMPSGTINMLVMLEQSIPGIAADVLFTIKSHPNYPVQPEEYPLLHLTIITDQLHTILQDFDMALSSNMTSASVDACLAGLPVIIVLEDAELNFSPLRGNANVNFVSNADELAHAVNRDGSHFSVEGIDDFFYLDPTLSRWEKILAS